MSFFGTGGGAPGGNPFQAQKSAPNSFQTGGGTNTVDRNPFFVQKAPAPAPSSSQPAAPSSSFVKSKSPANPFATSTATNPFGLSGGPPLFSSASTGNTASFRGSAPLNASAQPWGPKNMGANGGGGGGFSSRRSSGPGGPAGPAGPGGASGFSGGPRSFICRVCGTSFGLYEEMKAHIKAERHYAEAAGAPAPGAAPGPPASATAAFPSPSLPYGAPGGFAPRGGLSSLSSSTPYGMGAGGRRPRADPSAGAGASGGMGEGAGPGVGGDLRIRSLPSHADLGQGQGQGRGKVPGAPVADAGAGAGTGGWRLGGKSFVDAVTSYGRSKQGSAATDGMPGLTAAPPSASAFSVSSRSIGGPATGQAPPASVPTGGFSTHALRSAATTHAAHPPAADHDNPPSFSTSFSSSSSAAAAAAAAKADAAAETLAVRERALRERLLASRQRLETMTGQRDALQQRLGAPEGLAAIAEGGDDDDDAGDDDGGEDGEGGDGGDGDWQGGDEDEDGEDEGEEEEGEDEGEGDEEEADDDGGGNGNEEDEEDEDDVGGAVLASSSRPAVNNHAHAPLTAGAVTGRPAPPLAAAFLSSTAQALQALPGPLPHPHTHTHTHERHELVRRKC